MNFLSKGSKSTSSASSKLFPLYLIPAFSLMPAGEGVTPKILIIASLGICFLLLLIQVINGNSLASLKRPIRTSLIGPLPILLAIDLFRSYCLEGVGIRDWASDIQLYIYTTAIFYIFLISETRSERLLYGLLMAARIGIIIFFIRIIYDTSLSGIEIFGEDRGRYRLSTFLGASCGAIYFLALFIPISANYARCGLRMDFYFTTLSALLILATGTRIAIFTQLVITAYLIMVSHKAQTKAVFTILAIITASYLLQVSLLYAPNLSPAIESLVHINEKHSFEE